MLDAIGNDGLTDAERSQYAAQWREREGLMPSHAEFVTLRALWEAMPACVNYSHAGDRNHTGCGPDDHPALRRVARE
jgi:hypothetical protein